MIDDRLVKMLKRHEGFRQFPYKCSQGYLSCGHGRNLETVGVSRGEAETMLTNDIYKAIRELDKYQWFMALDDARRDALTDFMFNVGASTFAKFKKMIAALEKGRYAVAAEELLDSRYATQVGARADEIAHMLRTGEYLS